MTRPLARCSVCGQSKGLTDSGMIKFHRRHDVLCDGTSRPPKIRAPRSKPDDPKARVPSVGLRKRMLERDGYRCRKCAFYSADGSSLDANHVLPFADGGLTVLENLHTLCSVCHAELSWMWLDQPPVPYLEWIEIAPASRILYMLLLARGGLDIGVPRDHVERLLRAKP